MKRQYKIYRSVKKNKNWCCCQELEYHRKFILVVHQATPPELITKAQYRKRKIMLNFALSETALNLHQDWFSWLQSEPVNCGPPAINVVRLQPKNGFQNSCLARDSLSMSRSDKLPQRSAPGEAVWQLLRKHDPILNLLDIRKHSWKR